MRGPIAIAVIAALAGGCKLEPKDTPFDRLKALSMAFVEAVAAERQGEAHAMLCPAIAARLPLDGFRRVVAVNPFLGAGATFDAHTSRSVHGAAEIEGVVAANAGAAKAVFYASKLGGRWCLTGALIGGTPMLPTHGAVTAGQVESSDR